MKSTALFVVCAILASAAARAEETATLIEPEASVKKLAGDLKFTEGPVWLPNEHKLVFSDIPNSQLMQWSEREGLSVYRKSENANGNILDLQGRIISCQFITARTSLYSIRMKQPGAKPKGAKW